MSKHRSHEQHEIDTLPDCILHHILSFMPTKEVVKTSILSTRWKNLWEFVPNIDLDDELLHAKEVDSQHVTSFVNFVERVLQLRDASITEKFRLSCCAFHNASDIHSWISYAIIHNVQDLDISLFIKSPSMIPRSMFDSTSLVNLKIKMICIIELPSHVSFPNLKTLHLSFVPFLNNDFTKKLLSGCSVLEELVFIQCCLTKLNNIAISSSTLKSLAISYLSHLEELSDLSDCKIKIDAENLTYYEYKGYLLNEIFENNTPSLDKSFINIPHPGERVFESANRAVDLFKQLQCVVSLTLSNHTIETLLFEDNIRFPVFQNLTHLMLTMEVGMNHAFRVLMGLLSSCPVLESIYFSEGFMRNMHLGEKNSVWSSIPKCITNYLKTVTLKKFHGYNSEICFLKVVLKSACVLERIDICWCESYVDDLKRKTKVRKDLGKIEKISTACVIKFS